MRQYTLVWVDKKIVDRAGDNFHTFRIYGKVIDQSTSLARIERLVGDLEKVGQGRYQSEFGTYQYAIL